MLFKVLLRLDFRNGTYNTWCRIFSQIYYVCTTKNELNLRKDRKLIFQIAVTASLKNGF